MHQYPDLSFFFADLGGVHPVLPCWWREGFEPRTGKGLSLVVFSQIHLFSFSHFHLYHVQVEEYKKKYGPNGEFINNIWCQCWWSDESHTCLPHLFSQIWCHWKGEQGDNFRLGRHFQAGIKCDNMLHWGGWRKISRQGASRCCWANEKGGFGSMQRQTPKAGEVNKFPSWKPGQRIWKLFSGEQLL